MLANAFVFDSSKYGGTSRFGNVETEFFDFQSNAVEPALLSYNNLSPCADQVGRKWLDCLGNVKLASDGTAFAHEKVLAHGGLPRFERITAGALNKLRDSANLGKVKRDRNVVKTTEGESDFAKVRVARALTHAVDGPLDPGGTGADSGNCTSGGHAKIVMAVEMDGDAGTDPLADLSNEIFDGLWAAGADRVDDDDLGGARFKRSEVNFFQKFGVGARAIYRKKSDSNAIPFGKGNGVTNAIENHIAAKA